MPRWDDAADAATARARIIELRRDDLKWAEIGRVMWEAGEWPGHRDSPPSDEAVRQQWQRGLQAIISPQLSALRAERGERLAELRRRAQEILDRDHIVVNNGKVMFDPETGDPLHDDAPRVAAIRELRMIEAQLSQLHGENAPVKQQVTMDAEIKFQVVGVDPEALK